MKPATPQTEQTPLTQLRKVVFGGSQKNQLEGWVQVDRDTPEGMDLHLIVDNYSTHKHPKVKQWIQRHKRFHLHFIPTSSSWLNLVERWFGEITRKRIRRGVFKSVKDLIEAIQSYVKTNNQNPKPFVWTKRVDQILEKVNHCKASTVTAQ